MNATHCPTCKRRFTKSDKAKAYHKALRAGKAATIATRKQSTKEIREAVFHRAHGACEWCQSRFTEASPGHWHHMEGGSGRRREKQSVQNTVAICLPCHRGYHRDPLSYRPTVRWHCEKYGYPMPSVYTRRAA